jgi:hypothetical protein
MKKIKTMRFVKFQVILNSEGDILTLKENKDPDALNERMYVQGLLKNAGGHIIAKVNDTALKLFFDNKISLKELFLLRNDEPFLFKKAKSPVSSRFLAGKELDELMSQIHCGEHYYSSFSQNERTISPQKAIEKINMYFINGLGAIESN